MAETAEKAATTPEPTTENVEGEEVEEGISATIVLPSGDRIPVQQVPVREPAQYFRLLVGENASSATLTCFHFEHNGVVLNEQMEINAIEGLVDGAELVVIEDEYDDRLARGHVFRLRELLGQVPAANRPENPSVMSLLANPKIEFEGYAHAGTPKEQLVLTDFLPFPEKPPACVRQLSFSGWNPPPASRRLAGDLFYLEVRTLEGGVHYVTAWTSGFFVNDTKQGGSFDPSPASPSHASHNLSDLLIKLSPRFAEGFKYLLHVYFDPQSLDYASAPRPVVPWLAHREEHVHDVHRAEMDTIHYHIRELATNTRSREWASESRMCRDMPGEHLYDRMTRDRVMYNLHAQFVATALDGAVNILEGSLQPLNPFEDRTLWVYFANNIFYSFAYDQRDLFKAVGGDIAAYRYASHELHGIEMLNKAEVKGLYTSLSLVVDYLGQRVLCQGLIPGFYSTILEGVQPNIVYGVTTENKPLEADKVDAQFKQLMADFAKTISAKTHKVKDQEGNVLEVEVHYDAKGVLGTDNHRYLMELNRTTPRDLNYTSSAEDATYVLRQELVQEYQAAHLFAQRSELQKQLAELLKSDPELERIYSDIVRVFEGEAKDEEVGLGALSPELQEKRKKLEAIMRTEFKFPGPFNLDVGNPRVTLAGTEEENAADTNLVKKLAEYLKEKAIPRLAMDLILKNLTPSDGVALKEILHEKGVNMRYLGAVLQEVKKMLNGEAPAWLVVVIEREMIVRAVKYLFGLHLKESKPSQRSALVAKLLNALLGRPSSNPKGSLSGVNAKPFEKPVANKGNSPKLSQSLETGPVLAPTHDELWRSIRDRVAAKFGYTLPDLLSLELFALPTLRAVCQRVGIQLALRAYDLQREHIFAPEDIVRLFPVLKDVEPTSNDGRDLLEQAQIAMREGRPDLAWTCLHDAKAVFTNVYGAIHRSVAAVYLTLSRVAQRSEGQLAEALDYLERAVVTLERAQGLDHFDLPQCYANLAVVLQTVEPNKTALNYYRRALYLSELMGGVAHPDLVAQYLNLASMLQDLAKFADATNYIRKALALAESLFGALHPETGECLHALALNLTVLGEFREALAAETRHYEICKKFFGDADKRTVDSNLTLKTITTSAVTVAKAQQGAKKQQRLPNARPKTLSEQAAAAKTVTANITDLLNRAEALGIAPGAVAASTVKTQRDRVTMAHGSSWRARPAGTKPTSSQGNTSTPKPQQGAQQSKQQQSQQGQGKKGKKAANK